jgi:succinate dehydrogenase flavin-adding protein (antitoxin of CptAB toxin-antitoxin module)
VKTSTLSWIVVVGAAAFLAGFFAHKFSAGTSQPLQPPTYSELLTPALDLSDEQEQVLIKILADEDLKIQELLNGEHSAAIRRGIQNIREDTQEKILALLSEEQRQRFNEMLEAPGEGAGGEK